MRLTIDLKGRMSSDKSMENVGTLQSFLNGLGDVIRLKQIIDSEKFNMEVEQFSKDWLIYNPRKPGYNRMGLSLTSLDGGMSGVPDLDSIYEYNKINGTNYREHHFRTPTKAFHGLSSLHPILNQFPELGRSHLLRFDRGGFFPPHRDAFSLDARCFRVLVPLSNCQRNQYAFILDGKKIELEQWRAYYVETLKEHSVFAFDPGVILLVMNIDLTVDNINRLLVNIENK